MLNGIKKDIEDIFYPYVKIKSTSGTACEKNAEHFLLEYFKTIEYFKKNNSYFGAYEIKDDPLKRSVCWAMLRGTGKDTIVLMHHYDVVDVEDFKLLKELAYAPEELENELIKIKESFNREAGNDLESGEYLFGRGTADMKSGGSIQLALLKRYSEIKALKGNILLIVVPDEENLSAGMRNAVKLLSELKSRYDLNYSIMINSEPHQRKNSEEGVFSEGSVGKIMPFVYVRGYLSHIGKVFEGFNPLNLLCEIMRRTELNLDLSDSISYETSPPPTWLYLKDNKQQYDVSMPLSASGCLSILTLNSTPKEILDKFIEICENAFNNIIGEIMNQHRKFTEGMGDPYKPLEWKTNVTTFSSLYGEVLKIHGDTFKKYYEEKLMDVETLIKSGDLTMLQASFKLVDAVYDYVVDLSPRVVIGLVPPYYPNVSNLYFENISSKASSLSRNLIKYACEIFNQNYRTEYFFTGISDLSYSSIKNSDETSKILNDYMPLYGKFYDIPLDIIESISMPCINIGPWGKDFHKLTERVLKEDMFNRTPKLIHEAISYMLDWE